MKKFRNISTLALIALVSVIALSGCADGSGGSEDENNVETWMSQAEEEACVDNKIVAASQTTRTGAHVDPINGLLITCEDGSLDWVH